jgi:hypothetical protein
MTTALKAISNLVTFEAGVAAIDLASAPLQWLRIVERVVAARKHVVTDQNGRIDMGRIGRIEVHGGRGVAVRPPSGRRRWRYLDFDIGGTENGLILGLSGAGQDECRGRTSRHQTTMHDYSPEIDA